MYQNEMLFTVRGYELDSLGHLNNAVYLNYVEAARWEFFRSMEFLNENGKSKDGLFLIIIENTVKYIHELLLFDEVVVKTEYSCDGIYLNTKSVFIRKRDNLKVATSTSKLVFIDQNRQVYDMPDYVKEKIGPAKSKR